MDKNNYHFCWKDLGDIALGRPNLGNTTYVAVYRLMQYTMKSVLEAEYDNITANQLFYKAGHLAGKEFCKNLLNTTLAPQEFIAQLYKVLAELKIGVLKVEKSDFNAFEFTFVIEEDLDCSGLSFQNKTVCNYDEGFIAGILFQYTNKEFFVKEVDCWASGERVCRFEITMNGKNL